MLDIHTHQKKTVHSVFVYDMASLDLDIDLTSKRYIAIGIHPWSIKHSLDKDHIFKKMENYLLENQHIFIGETGLDRVRGEKIEMQLDYFYKHLDLSEKYCRPLIVHNVKSTSDFLKVLKSKKPIQSWLFHDWRGNSQEREQITRLHDKAYFSFGIPGLRTHGEEFKKIPLERIFFETDDREDEIKEVYQMGASLKEMELKDLEGEIDKNFKRFVYSDKVNF